ncbi:MAG: ABC transporter permease [Actinobacteria bacterium]|nr:ABC transporter permease [Actinomycetota bacterium]
MPLDQLAAEYGLKASAARPPIGAYLRQLWGRRHFIVGFATARHVAMYTEARLGQLWQVLTPLLNAAVYYLIFGVILDTKRGVPNFIPFLVTGIFVFTFTQRSFIIASRVINDSLSLIRALHFPRASLPLGYVVIELQQLLVSYVVLIAIVLAFGEPLTWYWLLVLPVLLMQTVFNVGSGLILARIGAGLSDVSQLLPFVVRTWMYSSGVMFSIQTLKTLRGHHKLGFLLQINPASVYITLTRTALLRSQRLSIPGASYYSKDICARYYSDPTYYARPRPGIGYASAHCAPLVSTPDLWLWGAGWAVLTLVVGFLFFWRAEVTYGRG